MHSFISICIQRLASGSECITPPPPTHSACAPYLDPPPQKKKKVSTKLERLQDEETRDQLYSTRLPHIRPSLCSVASCPFMHKEVHVCFSRRSIYLVSQSVVCLSVCLSVCLNSVRAFRLLAIVVVHQEGWTVLLSHYLDGVIGTQY